MPVAASALVTYALCPTCTGGGTAATPVNLNDLLDVTLTAPLGPGMALVWNPLTNQWINRRIIMDDLGDADTTTTPPVAGQTLIWNGVDNWIPGPAGGCAAQEIGGVGGVLLAGDGIGIPNPVATGWTLQANGLLAIAATAPATAPAIFEVRLEPAGTVLSTGTIAVGANAATFTANALTALADGQWLEVAVISSDGVAAELTVIAELCGPGGSSAAATLPALSYVHTQAVASTTWTIVHNLTFVPNVQIEDLTGADVVPDNVAYTSATTMTISFVAPQAGTARLS